MEYINIIPVQIQGYPEIKMCNAVRFGDIAIRPNKTAQASLHMGTLEDEHFQVLYSTSVEMTNEQYVMWGTEDDYAVNVFLANANLVKV